VLITRDGHFIDQNRATTDVTSRVHVSPHITEMLEHLLKVARYGDFVDGKLDFALIHPEPRRTAGVIPRHWINTETADFDAAVDFIDSGLELTRALKLKRFEAVGLLNSARCRYFRGERMIAADLAREGVQICRETGMGFCGPGVLGMLALVSDSDEERSDALAEAEAILEKGCLGHNYYWLHRDAMESYLDRRDWAGVEHHATALAEFMAEDPVPYATFYIERARALAAVGQDPSDKNARAELKRVREYAEDTHLRAAVAAIDRATAPDQP